MLHDVGKIAVPDTVLLKPGHLTEEDWLLVRRHPEAGYRLLEGADTGVLRLAASMALTHHERWDGDGYPDRLRNDDIPLASRIIFACDAYNAMTSDRPYRNALRPWIAVSELRDGAGGQFDPEVVDALVSSLREERTGGVRLFQQTHRVPEGLPL